LQQAWQIAADLVERLQLGTARKRRDGIALRQKSSHIFIYLTICDIGSAVFASPR
jgi:hypothetical protein